MRSIQRPRRPFLSSPRTGLKEFFINEALARLDALVQAAVLEARTEPPAAPQPGDAYLVAAGATGDSQGGDESIAVFQGTDWLFQAPAAGASLRRLDSGQIWIFSNGWSAVAEPAQPSGGSTLDSEARTAIAALISPLRHAGIFPAN